MPLKKLATDKAPSAIGPYSQGIIVNGFLFTAGQIPLDPVAGKIVDGGIVEQTDRATLESRQHFYEEVYKPRRDELAKAWSALSKQGR